MPPQEWFVSYRLRAVRVGVIATWWAVAALTGYAALPASEITSPAVYAMAVMLAAAGALVVHLAPWDRVLRSPGADVALGAWSAADIVLISACAGVTGGPRSPLLVLFSLTTIFAATCYPRTAQLLVYLFTALSLVSMSVLAGAWSWATVVAQLSILGVLAFMGDFLSSALREQATAAEAARAEAERRADVLAAVATAGREISVLHPQAVFEAVLDALQAIGFDAGDLCLLDDGARTYEVMHSWNLPGVYVRAVHTTSQGLVAEVLRRRATVVSDYRTLSSADRRLRAAGFRAVLAVPVWDGDRLAGVLEAGLIGRASLRRDELEAAELLALQAGRALENARRFTNEHRMVERLSDLNRLKREFLSTVSHELRTPLTVIAGMGRHLETRWEEFDDSTRTDLLQRLNANAESLERIVSELLDFSRLDTQRIETSHQSFDLASVVKGVVDRMSSVTRQHEVAVLLGDLPDAWGDPFLLERVFENLLTNAVRHTPAGTTVSITGAVSGRHLQMTVADDGPGIPPGDLVRIGTRFFRGSGESVRRTRGLGLGLAFVKEILELHGSELLVDSAPGEGSRFSFRLTVAHPPEPTGAVIRLDDQAEPAMTAPAERTPVPPGAGRS